MNRHCKGGGPTYSAVKVSMTGWVNADVWMEVKMVDGLKRGGLWASVWRQDAVASGQEISRMEAASN